MDNYTKQHLARWAENTLFDDERESIVKIMLNLIKEDPELLDNHSWSEIRNLADIQLEEEM